METARGFLKKLNTAGDYFKAYLNSYAFPFVTALFMIMCYYTGMDMLAMYYIAVFGLAILLLLDDITPLFTLFLFVNVMVSFKNSPADFAGQSDYYFRVSTLSQIGVILGLLFSAMAYRIIKCIVLRKFKITPIFVGLCILSVAFLLNGIFSAGYDFKNLMYGVMLVAVYLGIFVLFKDNIKTGERTFKLIAVNFMALSVLLIAETGVEYIANDFMVNGELLRDLLAFGWGTYNALGLYILLCVPAALYLAVKTKYGYLFTAYSILLAVACFASLSRQAMLGVFVIYPLSLFFFLSVKNKKTLIPHLIVLGIGLVALIIFIYVKRTGIVAAIKQLLNNIIAMDGGLDGHGRMELYRTGIRVFNDYPIFGKGFFGTVLPHGTNTSGLDFTPSYFHNTVVQLLAACGMVGLTAYVIHRAQTVYSLLTDFNVNRCYLAVSMLVIILLSLVDIHMFNIIATLIYGVLLPVFDASQKRPPQK